MRSEKYQYAMYIPNAANGREKRKQPTDSLFVAAAAMVMLLRRFYIISSDMIKSPEQTSTCKRLV
ncbi:hypothetical protein L0152_00475 [bacterium]|nr:hypothetical protein [bacterium]